MITWYLPRKLFRFFAARRFGRREFLSLPASQLLKRVERGKADSHELEQFYVLMMYVWTIAAVLPLLPTLAVVAISAIFDLRDSLVWIVKGFMSIMAGAVIFYYVPWLHSIAQERLQDNPDDSSFVVRYFREPKVRNLLVIPIVGTIVYLLVGLWA